MLKVVLWVVGVIWVLIGLLLMLGFWRNRDNRDEGETMQKHPIILAIVCLLFGPLVVVWAILQKK